MSIDLSDILFVAGLVCIAWPLYEHFGSVAIGGLGVALLGLGMFIGVRGG